MGERTREEFERSFRRAGLPLLIEDYSARGDVFTRAVPLLGLVFVVELLGAGNLAWPAWANTVALVAGLAILLGAVALVNRRAGRRSFVVPDRVGTPELAAFVIVPGLLPLLGGQVVSAVVTAAGNAALLLMVYAVVGYGVLAIVRWAARRVVGQLATSLGLLTRAIPVLFFFAIVLFLTTEMWQVFGELDDAFLVAVTLLFVAVGAVFLGVRLPVEVVALEREVGDGPPLHARQRLNVGLVMFVAYALQVLLVSVAVFAFFVAFGLVTIHPSVLQQWIGQDGHELLRTHVLGHEVSLTRELLRVSGAIAAFSGLYFAITVLTDSTYRRDFLAELEDSMRETFRERAEYLARWPARTY